MVHKVMPATQQHDTEDKNVGMFIADRSLAVDTPIE
jgi:hypothetical protein